MILALLLLFAQKPPSVSLAAPVDPVVAAKTHDQLAANLSPSAKSKLQNATLSIRSSASITDAAGRAAIASAFPGLSDSDTQALMFMAMMEASNASQQELSAISTEIGKMSAQKAKLGKTQTHPASVAKVMVQTAPVDYYRAPDPLPEDASPEDIAKRVRDLDAMSDANRLKMQTLKNQQQQMMTVVSNSFKAAQNVQTSVIRSLK